LVSGVSHLFPPFLQIANLKLEEVIANRGLLRTKVREEMHSVVQGWGIWLETVEVTDVRVLSSSVFEDLQTEFRQNLRGQAEHARIASNRAIELERAKADDEVERVRVELDGERQKASLWAMLELEREQAKIGEESHLLDLERLKRKREVQLREAEIAGEVERKRAEQEVEAQRIKGKAELEELKERVEVEKGMGQGSLQRVTVEAVKEVFRNLPLHDVKLYHTAGGEGLESLIPGLSHLQDALSKNKN
jgi:uncharacterized membrane protein YqiK